MRILLESTFKKKRKKELFLLILTKVRWLNKNSCVSGITLHDVSFRAHRNY
jgi:hypothetical protein